MSYRCAVCHSTDNTSYLRCNRSDCLDGRDQVPMNWRQAIDHVPMHPPAKVKTHMSLASLGAALILAFPALAIWLALAYWFGWIEFK